MDKKIPARKQVFFNIKILLLITQLQQSQGLQLKLHQSVL